MRILSNVTMSSNVSMASNAKDQFTIGSELERDNPNADDLKVWANANFYNDVIIGSSSADVLTVNAGTFNLSGTILVNNSTTNLYVSKQGSDSNTGLNSGSALLTIQAAVDKIASLNSTTNNRNAFHVTVHIASGSYEEKINLNNKNIGKSDSNLLVKFIGEKEVLYANVPATGALTVDPDLQFEYNVQCGIKLNFSGTVPEADSLKGCFLISSDGYRTAVINSHSGSNFYANSVGFGFNDIPQTINIVRPAAEVKGFFRTSGVNGVIVYDTIRIIAKDDGEDCIAFGGFAAPPFSLEYIAADKYRTVHNDEIIAYNCQIINSGTIDVIMPSNFQFVNGYINGTNNTLTLTNYPQADQLKIIGSLVEKNNLNLFGYKSVDFSSTDFLNNLGGISKIPSCLGPKKIKYDPVGGFITLSDVNIDFLPNFISKSAYLLVYGGAIRYYPSSYFIGPFNRIIDAYKTNIDFTYGGNGPPTGSHYFSGSLVADRLFIINNGTTLSTAGTLDVSNVHISGSYPLFYVYNSDIIHNFSLPITASITSSNYVEYDVQLDDVATYKYTDFPVVNQQGSLLDNRLLYFNLKTEFKIPFTASNGVYLPNSNLYLTGTSTIYYNGVDVFAGGGGEGGNSGIQTNVTKSETVLNQYLVEFTGSGFSQGSGDVLLGDASVMGYPQGLNALVRGDGVIIKGNSTGIVVESSSSNENVNLILGSYGPNSTIQFNGNFGTVTMDQIVSALGGGGGGGGGGYADSAVQQATQSYEPYNGGTGSYFSGTLLKDASGASNQAQIQIGHISASSYNIDSDIISLTVQQTAINIKQDGIDFQSGNNQVSLNEIISAVQGGSSLTVQSSGSGQNLVADYNNNTLKLRSLTAGNNIYFNGNGGEIQINANSSGVSSLQSTGSGESLVRDGNGTLRSLKSTPTVNVIQQTNELEIAVNSNLVLTSLRSEGWLTVSGNVQLGDQSTDTTTVTGQLTASNGINTTSLSASSTLQAGGTAIFGSNLNIYGNIGTSNGANQTKTLYAECTNGTVVVGGSGTTVSGSKAQFASLNLNSSQIETAWSSYSVSWTSSGTQPSLGNGTLTGYYKQIGKTVFVRVKLDWGSTTTGGTGDWRFSLPVSAVSSEAIQMPCSILDNGNAWYQATVNGRYSGLTDRSSLIGQSSVNNSSQGITSTFPITWGDGDSLQFNGSYEAA